MHSFRYGIAFNNIEPGNIITLEKTLKKIAKNGNNGPIQRIWKNIEEFTYQRLLKGLMKSSQLGKTSLQARADSGLNFDTIYKNQPAGDSTLGKLVDRILLKLPAAQATRSRKEKIVQALQTEIRRNHSKGVKTRIVDLGSGPARYLNEAIAGVPASAVEAICIDNDQASIRYGN